MGSLLDITERMQTLGTYIAFASLLGLAVLSLLYFAQARELKRLREWADSNPELVKELLRRLEEAKQQPSATAAPVAQTTQPIKQVAVQEQPQPDPNQQTLPIVQVNQRVESQETTKLPTVTDPVKSAEGPAEASADKASDKPTAEPSTDAAPTDPKQAAAESFEDTASSPIPKPATPLAGAKASLPGERPGLKTTTNKLPPLPAAAPLKRTVPTAKAPLPGGPTSKRIQKQLGVAPAGPSLRHRLIPLAVALAVVVIGVVAFTQLFGGDGDSPSSSTATTTGTESSTTTKTTKTLVRSKVRVVVLNGTTVPGLAAQIADKIEAAGFKRGSVTNAADQQRPATVVYYTSGNRRAALSVAKIVDVDQVEPIDSSTKTIAGNAADVVVTVGTDKTS